MSWIEVVQEHESVGPVRSMYQWEFQRQAARRGGPEPGERMRVGEIDKVFSLRPDVLRARYQLSNTLSWGGSALGRFTEEMIATAVSGLLGCRY